MLTQIRRVIGPVVAFQGLIIFVSMFLAFPTGQLGGGLGPPDLPEPEPGPFAAQATVVGASYGYVLMAVGCAMTLAGRRLGRSATLLALVLQVPLFYLPLRFESPALFAALAVISASLAVTLWQHRLRYENTPSEPGQPPRERVKDSIAETPPATLGSARESTERHNTRKVQGARHHAVHTWIWIRRLLSLAVVWEGIYVLFAGYGWFLSSYGASYDQATPTAPGIPIDAGPVTPSLWVTLGALAVAAFGVAAVARATAMAIHAGGPRDRHMSRVVLAFQVPLFVAGVFIPSPSVLIASTSVSILLSLSLWQDRSQHEDASSAPGQPPRERVSDAV